MRTTLKNMLIIVLLVLSGTMQAAAVEYKNNYRGVHKPDYQVQTVSTAAPSVTFQSTSAYSDQWNRDAQQSTLNSDGTVNSEAYGVGSRHPGSIRRTEINNPGDPNEEDDDGNTPIGDGLWVLLALAVGYALYRRKTRAIEN